jgi:heme/copper-type cytochrome/quinol oxidase subunit 2
VLFRSNCHILSWISIIIPVLFAVVITLFSFSSSRKNNIKDKNINKNNDVNEIIDENMDEDV